jgi:hypothetical protein
LSVLMLLIQMPGALLVVFFQGFLNRADWTTVNTSLFEKNQRKRIINGISFVFFFCPVCSGSHTSFKRSKCSFSSSCALYSSSETGKRSEEEFSPQNLITCWQTLESVRAPLSFHFKTKKTKHEKKKRKREM